MWTVNSRLPYLIGYTPKVKQSRLDSNQCILG